MPTVSARTAWGISCQLSMWYMVGVRIIFECELLISGPVHNTEAVQSFSGERLQLWAPLRRKPSSSERSGTLSSLVPVEVGSHPSDLSHSCPKPEQRNGHGLAWPQTNELPLVSCNTWSLSRHTSVLLQELSMCTQQNTSAHLHTCREIPLGRETYHSFKGKEPKGSSYALSGAP